MQQLLADEQDRALQRGAAAFRARQGLRTARRVRPGLCALRPRQCAAARSMHRSISSTSSAARRASAPSSIRHSSPSAPAAATRAPRRSSSWVCRAPAPLSWSRSSPATRAWRAPWSCPTSSTSRTNSTTWSPGRDGYPETVGAAPLGLFAALGSRYLQETAPLRTGREHFTDKLPNNFSHIGLIHADPAAGDHHRRAPSSDGLLLQHLQAALRRGTDLQLRP